MKHPVGFLAIALFVIAGCAGGPVKDYYNPAVVGKKFPGPVTTTLSETPKTEVERLVTQGYTIIGTAAWTGEYAKADELQAQARRVGANHVVYGARFVPAPPGSFNFRFGQGWGAGGGGGGMTDMYVVFLGKPPEIVR